MRIATKLVACTVVAGAALAMPLAAQDKPKIATVVKIAGIQWFNRMEEGVKKFAADTGADAFLVGPAQADPQQQVALIEDMIAQGVNALAVVPMSPEALEPVLGQGDGAGHRRHHPRGGGAEEHRLGHRGLPERGLRRQPDGAARDQCMGGEGEYAVFVGSLTCRPTTSGSTGRSPTRRRSTRR